MVVLLSRVKDRLRPVRVMHGVRVELRLEAETGPRAVFRAALACSLRLTQAVSGVELDPRQVCVDLENPSGIRIRCARSEINLPVEAVQDERDFRAFVLHFQAIIAYMKKDEGR